MKKRIKQIGVDVNRSAFLWNLIDVCNYKCNYCNAPHGTNFNDFKQFDNNKRQVCKHVVNRLCVKSVGKFHLDILGGEPTLHPDLESICISMNNNSNCDGVDIYTNLSKSIKYFQQFSALKKIRFIAAYHPQYYTNKFTKKIHELNRCQHDLIVPSINMSTNPGDWDQIEEIIDFCRDNDIKFRINFLHSVEEGIKSDIPDITTKKNNGIKWSVKYTDEFWYRFEDMINENWQSLTNTCYSKPNGSIRDYIDRDAVRTRNTYIPGIDLPVKYTDNTTGFINENELIYQNQNIFKNYKCKTRLYYIDLDGQIVNYCTGEQLPVYINEDELSKCRVCPHDVCDRRAFIYEDKTKYYREVTDEKHT